MSETNTCKEELKEYFKEPFGLDIGFGNCRCAPHAWGMDQVSGSYGPVGADRQQLRGDCRRLPFLADNALDWIYSSHLLEDFSFQDGAQIIKEWRRVIKPGGLLITNAPDQQRFLKHCAATGQSTNEAHFEQSFSFKTFKDKLLSPNGPWEEVFSKEDHPPYSFLSVVRKV